MVGQLIERLQADESHDEILIEASGALRNLAIEGGTEVCGEMANKGILNPLRSLITKLLEFFSRSLQQIRQGLQALATEAQNWARLLIVAENVVTLFWSLA